MPWEEFFGFLHDPFDPKPLQTEEQFKCLLVRTKPITDRIEPLLHQVCTTSFCKTILGDKGVGKSTALRYCIYLGSKEKMLPVLIQFHPAGVAKARNPVLETLSEIMTQIVQQQIMNTYEVFPQIFLKYRPTVLNIAKFVGLQWQEIEGFYRDPFAIPPADQKLLRSALESISTFLKQNNICSIIAIDNLDKLPFDVAKEFLGGQTAQPLFEYLTEMGSSIFISVDPVLEERIRVESDLSYLGERIKLVALSPNETSQLIWERIKLECADPEKLSLIKVDDDLITKVCNQKKGNTREILKEFSQLFQVAYERETRHLSANLYDKPIPKMTTITYYEIIEQNPTAKNGAEKILAVASHLLDSEATHVREFITQLFKGKQTSLFPSLLKKLFDMGIIGPTKKASVFQLHEEVYEVLKESFNRGIPPGDFLSWIMSKDIAKTVKSRYPTLKSNRVLKQVTEIANYSVRKTGKVSVMLPEQTVQWSFPEYFDKSIGFLRAATAYYNSVERQDWEDANPSETEKNLYYTLLNFLLSFSYYYILYAKNPVRAKDLSYWPLIFAVLHDIQEKGTVLKAFPAVVSTKKNHSDIKKGLYQPTASYIDRQLQDLENILIDLARVWEEISAPHLQRPEKDEHRTERIQERLIELANENLWRDVHGNERFDLIAYRTQDLGQKNRNQFLFAKIKVDSPPTDRDFLEFFANSQELIGKHETEQISNDLLKPNYYIWFISAAGLKKHPKSAISAAPKSRIYLKYPRKEDLEICFKQLNMVEFLELNDELLDAEDIDNFQEIQENFYTKGLKEAADSGLDYFETKLRRLVKEILQHHFGNDWFSDSTVPTKEKIEERMNEEKAKMPVGTDFKDEALDYSYISDLRDIILKKDNWKECFGIIFNNNEKTRDQFQIRMDEIQELRNKVKHPHELETFTCSQSQVQHVLQSMIWILTYLDQYEKVVDIFDKNKVYSVEEKNEGKLVVLGRIAGVVTKKDAEFFDQKIKEISRIDVYKLGGEISLNLEDVENKFGIDRKKIVLLIALTINSGMASLSREKFGEYRLIYPANAKKTLI